MSGFFCRSRFRRCRNGRACIDRWAHGDRWRVINRFYCVILNLLFHGAQFGDILLMLIVSFSKGMTTSTVGDEKQITGARRIGGGF